MPGTSDPLTPEFFVSPRCPQVAVSIGVVVAPKAGVREEVKHSSPTGAKVGDKPDFSSKVAREREDLGASDKG